ncbi:hypothetical protein GCM10023324_48360 [Streptomyces youssoufiensis]
MFLSRVVTCTTGGAPTLPARSAQETLGIAVSWTVMAMGSLASGGEPGALQTPVPPPGGHQGGGTVDGTAGV